MLGFLVTEPLAAGCTGVFAGQALMNSSLSFFTDQPWTIPLIGLLVTSLAFLMGRRWLVPRPAARQTPPPEEMAPTVLTTATLKPAEPDRRSAPRRKGNRVEVHLTDDSKGPPLLGWVVDRSMGGLCLIVEKPLTQGATLKIRPRQAPQTAPWLAIEIRSCRADGSEWEIGCRFLKAPQWNDLLLFG
jgi:hypothetical protein